jgi:hypothetical protein
MSENSPPVGVIASMELQSRPQLAPIVADVAQLRRWRSQQVDISTDA